MARDHRFSKNIACTKQGTYLVFRPRPNMGVSVDGIHTDLEAGKVSVLIGGRLIYSFSAPCSRDLVGKALGVGDIDDQVVVVCSSTKAENGKVKGQVLVKGYVNHKLGADIREVGIKELADTTTD